MSRGIWNRETVAMVWVAAALPLAVTWLLAEGSAGAIRLIFVLVVGGLCQVLFTVMRAQSPTFDERFRRLWRFYLAYCEAGFRSARTDVVQLALGRAA